ncbi:MAG: DUF4271 domain-containing protein [Flavobacteriaceae bacterium]|tara:strand:- start:9998 stop:10660 length:663 start_codon:yes stop_codon:yes gene_type:complete
METLLRPSFIADWILGVLLLSLLIMVLSKQIHLHRFTLFTNLLTNNKYVLVYNKKKQLLHPFQLLWQLFAILNTSLFLYLNLGLLTIRLGSSSYLSSSFILIFLGVAFFVYAKQLAQRLNGVFFNNNRLMKDLTFKKSSYFNYASIILFISNLLFLFLFPNSRILFFVSIGLAFLVILSGWLVIIRNHQKHIINNIFYFILYLCALEIAPFLIIVRIFKM